MLMCFVFYEYLEGGRETEKKTTKTKQNKKTSDIFLSISLEWLNNVLFGTEIAVGLGLALFRNAFR